MFFRQINIFTKEVTKELISRKFVLRDRIFQHFCGFYWQKFRESDSFTKEIAK